MRSGCNLQKKKNGKLLVDLSMVLCKDLLLILSAVKIWLGFYLILINTFTPV